MDFIKGFVQSVLGLGPEADNPDFGSCEHQPCKLRAWIQMESAYKTRWYLCVNHANYYRRKWKWTVLVDLREVLNGEQA